MAQEFNAIEANQLLENLSKALEDPTNSRSSQQLQEAGTSLIDYQNDARECVNETQLALDEIMSIMPEVLEEDPRLAEDQQYLKNKKQKIQKRLAECRLFLLRSEEMLTTLNQASLDVTTSRLFARGPHLGAQLIKAPKALTQFNEQFSEPKFITSLGLDKLKLLDLGFFIVLGLVVGLGSLRVRKTLKTWIEEYDVKSWPDQISQTLMSALHAYLIPLSLLFYAFVYFGLFALNDPWLMSMVKLCVLGLGLVLVFIFIDFLFAPNKPAKPFCHISDKYSKKFSRALKFLFAIIALGLLSIQFFQAQSLEPEPVFLTRSFFFTLTSVTVIYILLMLNRMPTFLAGIKKIRATMSVVCFTVLIIILLAEWWGYQNFSEYMLTGVISTLVATFLAWFIHRLAQAFLSSFGENKYPWQQSFHAYLGVEKQGSLPEMIGLKVGFFILIWGSWLISLLNIWTIGQTWAYRISDSLSKPWTFSNTDISFIPSRVIFGFIAFSLLILLVRFLRAMIQRKVRTSKDKAEREAYGAIFGYTGFAIAFVFALIMAGFDFKSLAFIAGALSVGIGFGLQNIVSNFISGIILLLERPIKPGDRISIGQEEGFVKKVSIRSTCITTLENVDVIIPNSELITKQVVNQTFNNSLWRVTVKVSVAYGSDVELVKKCLYEVAIQNAEVFKEGINKPQVFFLEFGDSSLNFEMWCIIKNVNMKLIILSELNSAIDAIFAERGITIPFPQRDLHIKDSHAIPIDINQEVKPKDE